MAKNSFLQAIFPRIKYSVSPFQKTNKGTTKIGKIIPVYATMLNGKESVSIDLGHLVRFAPSVVPTMEGYEVNFEAFKVSLNAIAYAERKERNIMDFHNFALNDGTEINPFSHRFEYVKGKVNGTSGHSTGVFFRPGLLGDYLNFPSLKSWREYIRKWLQTSPLFEASFDTRFSDSDDVLSTAGLIPYAELLSRYFIGDYAYFDDYGGLVGFTNSDNDTAYFVIANPFVIGSLVYPTSYSDWVGVEFPSDTGRWFGDFDPSDGNDDLASTGFTYPSLFRFICDNYPSVGEYYFPTGRFLNVGSSNTANYFLIADWKKRGVSLNYLDVLYELYKVDAQSVFSDWFNGLVEFLSFNDKFYLYEEDGGDQIIRMTSFPIMDYGYLPDIFGADMKPVDWTYFAAYWKIISDWYINTNIDGDPDTFFLSHCKMLTDPTGNYVELEPFERRWPNDIFTSSVPSSMVQNISIPADGTIPDLRQANAYQRFKDILRNTGKRLRDVLYGVRGYRPTAEASHMAVPVGTLHSYVGMSSILQTTPTDERSVQGSYAGIGTDSSGGNYRHILKVVNNDEPVPVVVMVLMSVTQRATYFQGFPRNFFRKSIYDFAVPQLANIGEQEVMTSELYFDYHENGLSPEVPLDTVFGFNRRYYDWFFEMNEVHGEMRDTEDYWHGARIFDDAPALNSEFIAIDNQRDHLGRIFANASPSSQTIYYNVMFEGEKVVALPRYIQYDL